MKFAPLCLAVLGTTAGLRAADLPLKVDATRSNVDVVVKATVDSFVGKLDAYDVAITVDAQSGEVRSARFAFHFADVKTGKADRDEQMHAWQDTPHHPDGLFTLVTLARDPSGHLMASGTLTLHDMAREISFPASVTHEGGLYAIDGDATLDTREFGLPIIKKFMLLKVDPEVHVRFHLQGVIGEAAK